MKLSRAIAAGLTAASLFQGAAATFLVTSTSSDGAGSLGQAILDANAAPGADLIHFNLAGTGPQTISLEFAALPPVTDPVTIDGTSQPGFVGTPLVFIDGSFRRRVSGLVLHTTGCTISGLAIGNCGASPSAGILLEGGGGHHIQGCYLGVAADGVTALRNRDAGLRVINSQDNVIGGTTPAARNVISGNTDGVVITGAGSLNNVVAGNFIGLTATGTAALPNFTSAVEIQDGASGTRLGGTEAGARNVIAGGSSTTVMIDAGTTATVIQGNFIGLKADGTLLGPTLSFAHGISLKDSAGNLVGGLTPGAGNVISGTFFGVDIGGALAVNNSIQGNFLGTDPTGMTAIPNATGVFIGSGAGGNLVGGGMAGARNVISGNRDGGVNINGADNNRVQGNLIGTDVTGTAALGNGQPNAGTAGVIVFAGNGQTANDNLIGGGTAAERNVISGNQGAGVAVIGRPAQRTRVQGNFIGTTADGTAALGNLGDGVQVHGAVDTLVGAAPDAPVLPASPFGNVIAGNQRAGVQIAGLFGDASIPAVNTKVGANQIIGNARVGVREVAPVELSSNAILGNGGLPIDRLGDGIANPNMPGSDFNSPVIEAANWDGSALKFTGEVPLATPGLPVRVEFFANPDVVGPGFPGLETPVGKIAGTTGLNGVFQFKDVSFPFKQFPPKSCTGVALIGGKPDGVETTEVFVVSSTSTTSPCPPDTKFTLTLSAGDRSLGRLKLGGSGEFPSDLLDSLSLTIEGGTPPYQLYTEDEWGLVGGGSRSHPDDIGRDDPVDLSRYVDDRRSSQTVRFIYTDSAGCVLDFDYTFNFQPAPTLRIEPEAGGMASVLWSDSFDGFHLEKRPTLDDAPNTPWEPVPDQPLPVGGNFSLKISPQGQNLFLRLRLGP